MGCSENGLSERGRFEGGSRPGETMYGTREAIGSTSRWYRSYTPWMQSGEGGEGRSEKSEPSEVERRKGASCEGCEDRGAGRAGQSPHRRIRNGENLRWACRASMFSMPPSCVPFC